MIEHLRKTPKVKNLRWNCYFLREEGRDKWVVKRFRRSRLTMQKTNDSDYSGTYLILKLVKGNNSFRWVNPLLEHLSLANLLIWFINAVWKISYNFSIALCLSKLRSKRPRIFYFYQSCRVYHTCARVPYKKILRNLTLIKIYAFSVSVISSWIIEGWNCYSNRK